VGYDRGIFSSNATTRITPRGSDAPAVLLHHDITHGPFSMRGDRLFCLARVTTVADIEPGNATSPLRTAFQNKIPLRARTNIALNGAVNSRITSPEDTWRSRDTEFTWGGLNGTVALLRGGQSGMNLDFRLPRLETNVPGQTGDVLVRGVRLSRSLRRDAQGAIQNGTASFRCSRVEAHAADWGGVRAESVALSSRTERSNGLLRTETELGFEKGHIGEVAIRQSDFQVLLENLDGQALRQWRDLLSQNPKDVSRKQLQGIAKDLLSASPRMSTAELRMQTGEGEVRLDATASFNGTGDLSVRNSRQMLDRFTMQSSLSVPLTIGVRLASIPVRFMGVLNQEEGFDAQAGDMERKARSWLKKLRDLGYISKDSGSYGLSLKLKKGMLSVSDKPVLPLGIFLQSQ